MLTLPDTPHLEICLDQIARHSEAASVALTHVDEKAARRQMQECMAAPTQPSLVGLVATVKACIDVRGWISHAGSAALLDTAPSLDDAALVACLRDLGVAILAQTNMTEFAYGALGVNKHFGTPLTPLYPHETRVAGGSSSGAAISIALRFADIALCSDTSGSARIPAAFCGVLGFMPTRNRWPMEGYFPLSPSFDTPGIMTQDAITCRRVFTALDGVCAHPKNHSTMSVSSPGNRHRLCVPRNLLEDQSMNGSVHHAFEWALEVLQDQGWVIEQRNVASVFRIGSVVAEGGIIAADAYSVHRELLEKRGQRYDPSIRARILAGAEHPAWRYAKSHRTLSNRARQYEDELSGFDAMITPTTPMLPPKTTELEDLETYSRLNQRSFIYTEIANRMGVPSITLPLPLPCDAGIGILITGKAHGDRALIDLAIALEAALNQNTDIRNHK